MEELLKLLQLKKATEASQAVTQPTGLLGNTNALIGAGLLSQGAAGKGLFEAALPSLTQAAQIRKLIEPKMGALKQAFDPKTGKTVFASDVEIRQKGLTPIPQAQEEIEYLPGGGFRMTKGGTPTAQTQKDLAAARDIQGTNFQLNNVGKQLIDRLQTTKVGGVGGIISSLDSVGSQIKQAANTFGILKDYRSDSPGLIDSVLKENFNLSKEAENYEIVRSNIVNMAFLMAKQDEPGGRFSDKDIALRIRQLGVGQNPQKTSKVIENVLSLANENANNNYNLLTGKNLPSFEEKEKKKKKEKSEDPLGLGF
jgi:hypothetical protein